MERLERVLVGEGWARDAHSWSNSVHFTRALAACQRSVDDARLLVHSRSAAAVTASGIASSASSGAVASTGVPSPRIIDSETLQSTAHTLGLQCFPEDHGTHETVTVCGSIIVVDVDFGKSADVGQSQSQVLRVSVSYAIEVDADPEIALILERNVRTGDTHSLECNLRFLTDLEQRTRDTGSDHFRMITAWKRELSSQDSSNAAANLLMPTLRLWGAGDGDDGVYDAIVELHKGNASGVDTGASLVDGGTTSPANDSIDLDQSAVTALYELRLVVESLPMSEWMYMELARALGGEAYVVRTDAAVYPAMSLEEYLILGATSGGLKHARQTLLKHPWTPPPVSSTTSSLPDHIYSYSMADMDAAFSPSCRVVRAVLLRSPTQFVRVAQLLRVQRHFNMLFQSCFNAASFERGLDWDSTANIKVSTTTTGTAPDTSLAFTLSLRHDDSTTTTISVALVMEDAAKAGVRVCHGEKGTAWEETVSHEGDLPMLMCKFMER